MKHNAYYAGFEAKKVEIEGMGWVAARDKFNLDYPKDSGYSFSKCAWEYAKGEMDALLNFKH